MSEFEHERELRRYARRAAASERSWMQAAEEALKSLPGASCSGHPGHRLWVMVELRKQPPVDVVQS